MFYVQTDYGNLNDLPFLFSVASGESSRTLWTPGGYREVTVVTYTPDDNVRPINLNTPIEVFELVDVSRINVLVFSLFVARRIPFSYSFAYVYCFRLIYFEEQVTLNEHLTFSESKTLQHFHTTWVYSAASSYIFTGYSAI